MSGSIRLMIELEAPKETQKEACPRPTVEERVRDMVELCMDGSDNHAVHRHFITLRKTYESLSRIDSERARNLMRMIEPVLAKYGYHSRIDKKV